MTYSTDIDALNPSVRYPLSTDANDAVGALNGTNSGGVFTGVSICRDNVNSYLTNGITDRIVLPTSTLINNANQTRKAVCGWFSTTGIQNPPKNIYGDGGTNQAFRFILGWGNYLVFEVDDPNFTLQIFGDVPLEVNRPYHLCMIFEGNGFGNKVRAYLDGVEQLNAEPINRTPNAATLTARTVGEFGDPAGAVSVGGTAVVLLAPINGQYAQWAMFDGATAVLTETEVRETLFEKGAIPTVTIIDQAGLDALAGTVRPNSPLCIQVNSVSGSNLTLTADNVTFDPLSSIHIQWTDSSILTWINTNGSNASISSATGGGTVVIENPATLTILGVINGAEVRIYDDEDPDEFNFDTELAGIETLSGTSYQYAHAGATNTVVIQMIADGYEEVILYATLGASDQTVQVFPVVEENT